MNHNFSQGSSSLDSQSPAEVGNQSVNAPDYFSNYAGSQFNSTYPRGLVQQGGPHMNMYKDFHEFSWTPLPDYTSNSMPSQSSSCLPMQMLPVQMFPVQMGGFPTNTFVSPAELYNNSQTPVGNFFQIEHSSSEGLNIQKSLIYSNPILSRENGTSGMVQVPRQLQIRPLQVLNDDRRDTNLKLIIRKELSNSDVTSVGRIVLPKRDSEAHLPQLTEKEGIILNMDDHELPHTWQFKYRFWPNNRSRMYVMENAGDFIKAHDLKAGDYFIIYKSLVSHNYVVSREKVQRSIPTVPRWNS